MIILNSDAVNYFNDFADKFLYKLCPAPKKRKSHKAETSASHAFIQTLKDKDIISVNAIHEIDGFGKLLSRYFLVDGNSIGIGPDEYSELDKFIQNLYKKKEINTLLSKEFLYDTTFDWFKDKYTGAINETEKYIPYLLDKAKSSIKKTKVSIPIPNITIEKPFYIGKVKFEYFTKSFFDEFAAEIEKNALEHKVDEHIIDEGIKKLRKKYQGLVFSSIQIEAEKKRSIEIAVEETDKALMILRFFSPTTFIPEIPSYLGRMGQIDIPKDYILIFQNKFPEIIEKSSETRETNWPLHEKELKLFYNIGLKEASDLLIKNDCSELEKVLINSIFLFSRAITSRDFHDKLVFILVSVETLLLQNSNEPIQINIGQRLAFLTSQTSEDRKRVMELVRKAYALRSSFIHHGISKTELKLLRDIQHIAWTALRNVLLCLDKFENQKSLIDFIQELILS